MNTSVTFLLDRTGSMAGVKAITISAFNEYINALKKGVDITFSLIQFDSMSLDKLHVNVPVANIQELTDTTYVPRGSTPLIDAAYKTIKAVEASNPTGKVVICIQTDGEENASTEYSWDQLNALIKEKTALGWEFNFMGAGIDAYQQGAKMGIAASHTVSYDKSSMRSTRSSFSARGAHTVAYASGGVATMYFASDEKMAAGDKFDPDLTKVVPPVPPKPVEKTKAVDDFSL